MKTKALIPLHDLHANYFLIGQIEKADSVRFGVHHRHQFYEILWFTSNGQDHSVDFEDYPVCKNLVYFLAPGQVHAMPGPRPTGFVIALAPEFVNGIPEAYLKHLFNLSVNEGIQLIDEQLPPLELLVRLLQLEQAGGQHPLVVQSYVKAFLLHIYQATRETNPAVAQFSDKRLVTLSALIQQHYREERKTDFYADHLGLTPQRVNELLKEKWGYTITQAIHNQLILEAKRSISLCERSFKEIAFDLGFNEQAYFSRFFKKQTGITPEAFREKILARTSS
ncbi:helix-turn-helix domain-containing protein [Hymenobacter caeli]|uniref:AraC-like DNA-binding protein n=1 Tax=Hymenobacter caeli TaxID=2735894 RepID=A0ABX2FWJ3_9BACT|nr:helix-turn-helix domain-containing protein [Hymenobacter caeli]NRT20811.1 AraC-like DNA-binding protein [Hymenobacter caeli]